MNNLNDVWRKRFVHYVDEVQKYMRYIFTGHMALVIVFLIGAGGYKYSNWLNTASHDFPTIWFVAIVIGCIVAMSRPITLLKKADEVYLLPLESKMGAYFKKALHFTFAGQMPIAVVIYFVCWPMMRRIGEIPVSIIVMGLVFVVLLKWWNIHCEFTFRWALEGHYVWLERIVRAVLSTLVLYTVLSYNGSYIFIISSVVVLLVYPLIFKKGKSEKPFPYEHFVRVEENRMLRIYRFANYFTDVPSIQGSIKRRRYFDFIYNIVPKTKKTTFEYYLLRSLIRSDDHFFLFLRLTIISALVAAFAHMPVVIAIVVAALAFATAIQLKQSLSSQNDFSMSQLYPLQKDARKKAAIHIVRYAIIIQAIIVLLAGIGTPYFFVQAIIVYVVGELTLRFSK